jgi:hypothetical protein
VPEGERWYFASSIEAPTDRIQCQTMVDRQP